LVGVLPMLASFLVLKLAQVAHIVYLIQGLAILLSVRLAMLGGSPKLLAYFARYSPRRLQIWGSILCCVLLAWPIWAGLLAHAEGPQRWAHLGSFRLYIAPVVLPAALYMFAQHLRDWENSSAWTRAFFVIVAAVLAIQPDLSQVVAWSLGVAAILLVSNWRVAPKLGLIVLLLLAVVFASMKPDPLVPVPYVELVFAFGLQHSILLGCLLLCSASVWLIAMFYSAYQAAPISSHLLSIMSCYSLFRSQV